MTWGSDVTLLNDAITKVVAYANARDVGTPPYTELVKLKDLAYASLLAAAAPLSASLSLPKLHHGI